MTGGLPNFNPISSQAKLIGGGVIILILVSLLAYGFYRAYHAGVDQANTKISEYEKKISELNTKLLQKEIIVRERVITDYHTKTIVRTQIEYKNRDIIHTVVPIQFNLSKGWIYAHDQSAKGALIDPILAADPAPSTTSDKEALETVSENYNKSHRTADQLQALQTYIREVGIPITNDPKTTINPK